MLHGLELAQIEVARAMGCEVIDVPGGVALFHPLVTMRSFNCATLADPAALPDAIADVRRVYRERDRQPLITVADHRAPTLTDALERSGWRTHGKQQLFMERVGPPPAIESGIEIALLTLERVQDYVAIVAEAFGWDAAVRSQQAALYHWLAQHRAGRHYMAFADHKPIATATLLPGGDAWGIYKVATLPGYRGRGIAAALVARAIGDALLAGADRVFLYTEWGSRAEALYGRLGFAPVFRRALYQPGEVADARR